MDDRDRAVEADARLRDAAVTDDRALVAYERKWAKRLEKLQRSYPGRWRVPGLSDEELRDELTLRLIEAVRTRPQDRARERPGKEWGLLFLAEQLRVLRASHKLRVELTDPSFVVAREPDDEERLLTRESELLRTLARERAERALSRPQRGWLAGLKRAADDGAFFEASGKLNLSAASRALDKHRSSAQRAFAELSRCFTRERDELEAPARPERR